MPPPAWLTYANRTQTVPHVNKRGLAPALNQQRPLNYWDPESKALWPTKTETEAPKPALSTVEWSEIPYCAVFVAHRERQCTQLVQCVYLWDTQLHAHGQARKKLLRPPGRNSKTEADGLEKRTHRD